MSWRTAIEINHDYIYDLERDPEALNKLLQMLRSGDWQGLEDRKLPGITLLGSRHHSEKRTYETN